MHNFYSESEGAPSPKRSARRMCKESLKSTVLESAIARKEKSNYTEEHLQFKPIRKYSKPGRPKKIFQAKEMMKQSHFKVLEARHDLMNNTAETNSSYNEMNSALKSSKNLSFTENSVSDSAIDDSQNSSAEFDGMPKLSPIMKNTDPLQTKLSNPVGSPISEDGNILDMDKPFLRPATGRTKRERGRPRGSTGTRKIAKSDSFEGKDFHFNKVQSDRWTRKPMKTVKYSNIIFLPAI